MHSGRLDACMSKRRPVIYKAWYQCMGMQQNNTGSLSVSIINHSWSNVLETGKPLNAEPVTQTGLYFMSHQYLKQHAPFKAPFLMQESS